MRKIADPKYDVNFFPVVDRERELPVYAVGIGAGHEQEELTIGNWMGINVLHLHMTVSGCGVVHHEGKRYILPIGTMMYTPPKVTPHIAPAPGGWIDNWVTIFLGDLSPGSSILSLGDKLRIFRPENPISVESSVPESQIVGDTSGTKLTRNTTKVKADCKIPGR